MSETTPHSPLRFLPFGVIGFALLAAAALLVGRRHAPLPVIRQVTPFALTNQLGHGAGLEALQGRVWVANIIFTRCTGPCREMTRRMEKLQSEFATEPGVRFVTLTADPEFDTSAVLARFAEKFHANPARWMFLTGPKREIVRVATQDLLLTAVDKSPSERTAPEDLFIHSTISVVVDGRGRLRASVEALEPDGPARLRELVRQVLIESAVIKVSDLPAINASLNGVSFVLLVLGYVFIRRGQREAHQSCMLSAFACSCVFLLSYVIHKVLVHGVHTPIGATGWIRTAYHVMLASHILLAIVVVPMALVTIRRGMNGRLEQHRKIARITWPVWVYVSATGVLIYFMLYQWFPA